MYQRILVPTDGSPTSNRGVAEAIRLASLTQGRIRFLHVIDAMSYSYLLSANSDDAQEYVGRVEGESARMLQEACSQAKAAGVETETVVYNGVQGRLCEFVERDARDWQAELVVLGTHGRRGINRMLLGSDAEQIVRTASVPVLLVRLAEQPAAAQASPAKVHVHLPSAALAFE